MGQYFIFGALCPSKSGLMNKHIVKHIVGLRVIALFLGALCPSKSGLMNKHIVKHIGHQCFTREQFKNQEVHRGRWLSLSFGRSKMRAAVSSLLAMTTGSIRTPVSCMRLPVVCVSSRSPRHRHPSIAWATSTCGGIQQLDTVHSQKCCAYRLVYVVD